MPVLPANDSLYHSRVRLLLLLVPLLRRLMPMIDIWICILTLIHRTLQNKIYPDQISQDRVE